MTEVLTVSPEPGYDREMERAHVLAKVVAVALGGETGAATDMCLRLIADPHTAPEFEAQLLSVMTVSEYFASRFDEAILASERAVAMADEAGTAAARLLALPSRLYAAGGFVVPTPGTPSTDAFAVMWQHRDELGQLDANLRLLATFLFAEAAFVNGHLDAASELLATSDDAATSFLFTTAALHPLLAIVLAQPARLLTYQGHIDAARLVAESARDVASRLGLERQVIGIDGIRCLIAGQLSDRSLVRQLADEVEAAVIEPRGYIEGAPLALCAYGLAAVGDGARAVQFVLAGGGGPGLPFLQAADRALSYEMLCTIALEANDIPLASDWARRSLELGAHPVAVDAVERTTARLDLALGNVDESMALSAVSAARSMLAGRHLEASGAEVLRARALARTGARSSAVERLTVVAHESEREGRIAVAREAVRELRSMGRRLAPAPHAGYDSLSTRERQVVALAAEGYSNRVIGAALFLSERTVQGHISRALAALGVASRTAIPRQLVNDHHDAPASALHPPLTSRQREIACLVAAGASNHAVADELGISVKTVEKHIGAIFIRWGVSSRTGIAAVLVAEQESAAPTALG